MENSVIVTIQFIKSFMVRSPRQKNESSHLTREVKTNKVRHNLLRIRTNNSELDTLHARAKSMDLSVSEYVRWRGLQPIGRLKKPKEIKAMEQSAFVAYIAFAKELNRQGINLNQLTRAVNLARIEGQSVENSINQLSEIHGVLREIADSVRHLGANP
jgi:hypothetical protein